MSSKTNNPPAFPTPYGTVGGMSLRDYFAAAALQGDMAYQGMEGCDAKYIAACAYEIADAMLLERAKIEEKEKVGA